MKSDRGLVFATEYSHDAPALLYPGKPAVTYGQLEKLSEEWCSRLSSECKQLVFHYISNTPSSIAALLGTLLSGNAVALLDPKLSREARNALEDAYRPWVVLESVDDETDTVSLSSTAYGECGADDIHPDLAVLLSTSGSSGSPKFVRLSLSNLQSNASAIADVMSVSPGDVALAHLEIHYSYGLSIITSHLAKGASIGFVSGKFTDRGFWEDVRTMQITHMPGVPYHHEMINRLGLNRLKLPSLTSLSQAGGRLSESVTEKLHAAMDSREGRFYVMYGQTEASPRMTTLPHEEFLAKPGSVGKALPGGQISIVDENGQSVATGTAGEVIYRGPNVMLGYAHDAGDLCKSDESKSELHTGDKGYLDEDGYLYIVGRLSRMAKIFGWRLNLDEIEQFCEKTLSNPSWVFAAVQSGNEIHLVTNGSQDTCDEIELQSKTAEKFALPNGVLKLKFVAELPLNPRGKVDYNAVSSLVSNA